MTEETENSTLLRKKNKINKYVNWNDKLELAVKDIGDSCKNYKLLHIYEAQRSNKIYNILMLIGIVIGPLSGLSSGIGTIMNDKYEILNSIIPIINTILGFFSGIVIAIVKFGKYDESSNANKQAAARYTSIESNVRRQLGLYRNDRLSALLYMEWLETKYEELFLSAPLIPFSSYKRFKKLGINIPEQYDSDITINTEYENIKIEEIINSSDIKINIDKEGYIPKMNIENIKYVEGCKKDKKKIKRTNTMSKFPQLNQYSDKMLEYEMKRMIGFSK